MKIITPLNEQETDQLNDALKHYKALDLSAVDGFFTAMMSGPKLVSPEQWLPIVFQQEKWEHDNLEEFESLFTLLVRHLNGIGTILSRAPEQFEPIFLERDLHDSVDVVVHHWCEGYLKGINLFADEWKSHSASLQQHLTPIVLFGSQQGRESQQHSGRSQILQLKEQLPIAARAIYQHWSQYREQQPDVQQPFIREAPKVGRNDLCRCGSGKKFKRCCGAH